MEVLPSFYYAIAEEFGTMEEFDELLAETKKRGMYLIMDLVINHCSDQHEWFQKALKDPAGEYGDYFYFRKGKEGNPPSNYRSYFGGSCWEPVPGTDLYYFHMFAKEQPDLNWENPTLRNKLYEMINWWLDKGLAGFRIDAIINIKKDPNFPDFEPDGADGLTGVWRMVESVDGVDELLEDLKHHTFEKYDAYREVFTYGEFVPVYEDSDSVMAYYRVLGEKRILVAANFGKERVEIPLEYPVKQIVLSNKNGVSSIKENLLTLQSCKVIVLQM